MSLTDELMAVEAEFWGGGADTYREHVDDECLVAFADMGMVMSREEIAGAVEDAPRWRDLETEPEGLVRPTDDVVLLTYRAGAVRGEERYRARVSSAYVRRDDGWKLAFHQQTPLPPEEDADA